MKGEIKKAHQSRAKDICNFIKNHEEEFTPSLSERVDIGKYTEKLLDKGVCYVYEREKNLQGFIAFYANNCAEKLAYLSLILISENYRGKGVSEKMMKKMETYCKERGFKRVEMEMAAEKERLKKWYIEKGYKKSKKYNRKGNECIVMHKEL